MKKTVSVLLSCCMVAGLCACSPKEGAKISVTESTTIAETSTTTESGTIETTDTESVTEESTDVQPAPEQTTAAEESSAPSTAAVSLTHISSAVLDMSAISALDNTSISWGYSSTQRDESNRPLAAVSYQDKYGAYGASFLEEPADTPVIYLTFDEGYENGYTPAILDTLKQENVKAVFFVTMSFAKKEPELVQRMIDEGHVVGGHSISHPADGMPSLGAEGVASEIVEMHNYMVDTFGYSMYLFRFPAGIFSVQTLAILQGLGYQSVFWSFAHRDWVTDDQPDPATALTSLESQRHNGAIYLLHAVSSTNTSILGEFIENSRAEGYTFGIISRP